MKLPKNWSEVTIETFLKYYTISTRKWENPIDCEINLIACFSGQTPEEVEKLKHAEFIAALKKLSFLKELPKGKAQLSFVCNGSRYRPCLVMTDMVAGQFMNFSDILKGIKPEDYVYEMHKLLGVMCLKRKTQMKWPFIKYNYDGYVKTSDEFYKHMTMDIAYPYFVFFCQVMEKSLPAIQDYLTKQLRKLKRSEKRKRWGLASIGVGILSLIPFLITMLQSGNILAIWI